MDQHLIQFSKNFQKKVLQENDDFYPIPILLLPVNNQGRIIKKLKKSASVSTVLPQINKQKQVTKQQSINQLRESKNHTDLLNNLIQCDLQFPSKSFKQSDHLRYNSPKMYMSEKNIPKECARFRNKIQPQSLLYQKILHKFDQVNNNTTKNTIQKKQNFLKIFQQIDDTSQENTNQLTNKTMTSSSYSDESQLVTPKISETTKNDLRRKIDVNLHSNEIIEMVAFDELKKASKTFKKSKGKFVKYSSDGEIIDRRQIMESLLQMLKFIKYCGYSINDTIQYKIFSSVPFEKQHSEQFMQAARLGKFQTIQYLTFQNKYLVYDYDNMTALHWTCKKGFYNLSEFLIQNLSNINSVDIIGRTPLYLAIENGHDLIVQLLLLNEASPFSSYSCNYEKLLEIKPSFKIKQTLSNYKKIHSLQQMMSHENKQENWKNFVKLQRSYLKASLEIASNK